MHQTSYQHIYISDAPENHFSLHACISHFSPSFFDFLFMSDLLSGLFDQYGREFLPIELCTFLLLMSFPLKNLARALKALKGDEQKLVRVLTQKKG